MNVLTFRQVSSVKSFKCSLAKMVRATGVSKKCLRFAESREKCEYPSAATLNPPYASLRLFFLEKRKEKTSVYNLSTLEEQFKANTVQQHGPPSLP